MDAEQAPVIATINGLTPWDGNKYSYTVSAVRTEPEAIAQPAISDGYAGLERKHVAFGMASIRDELARHFRDLDEQLRVDTLVCCRQLLGEP